MAAGGSGLMRAGTPWQEEAGGVTHAGYVLAGRAGFLTPFSTNIHLEGIRQWLGATAANLQSSLVGASQDLDLLGVPEGPTEGLVASALKPAPGSQESSCKGPLQNAV